MASKHAGQVTVKVVPDLTGFNDAITDALTTALKSMGAETLLHQYSEWLDDEGIIKGGDERTHADLVRQFLEQRSKDARPLIDNQ